MKKAVVDHLAKKVDKTKVREHIKHRGNSPKYIKRHQRNRRAPRGNRPEE